MDSNRSLRKSALIVAGGKYANIFCAFVANIVLSRLLTPEDFGIIAVVTVFSTFFSLFSDMGFGAGVIQNKELEIEDIESIFSITLYLASLLAVLFFFLSYVIADIYDNSVYVGVGKLLSVALFFSTANMIPNSVMMREKRFLAVGIRSIAVAVISYSITIILAVCGLKYYALVFQAIISNVVIFTWNLVSTKLKFTFFPSIRSIKKILSFSVYNFIYDLVNYFSRNLDNMLTGKTMGSVALGYYNKAYTLMLYPTNYLTNVITPVLHPILSDYQSDRDYIYKQYLKIFKVLFGFGIFFTVCCFAASKEVISVLFGAQWAASADCVHILSWTICVQMVCASCTSIFRSLGRTDLRMKSSFIYVPVQIAFIAIGAYSGSIVVLSWWVAVSYILRFCIEYYYLIHKAFGKPIIVFIKDICPLLLDYLVLLGIGAGVSVSIRISDPFISLIIKGIICTSAYVLVMLISKQYHIFSVIIPKRICNKF